MIRNLVSFSKREKEWEKLLVHVSSSAVDSATDWNAEGNLAYERKDYLWALSDYEKAISLNPNEATYWGNKAAALISLHCYSEALIAYEKAISLNSNYSNPYYDKNLILSNIRISNDKWQCPR